ncbi:hypothetical protein CKA32_001809 [Geitlerinema sp. FC II]|nr:hypothetical protein CKA32_001809 [Geitlerinema sp. FC II]
MIEIGEKQRAFWKNLEIFSSDKRSNEPIIFFLLFFDGRKSNGLRVIA